MADDRSHPLPTLASFEAGSEAGLRTSGQGVQNEMDSQKHGLEQAGKTIVHKRTAFESGKTKELKTW